MTADGGAGATVSIRIDALDPQAAALWRTVARLARELPPDGSWCLVGGLMVALFDIEAEQTPRATTDIDLLGDARIRPSATEQIAQRLKELGGELHDVSGLESQRGFRISVDDQIVDVLAPDGLPKNRPPLTIGNLQTIQIPGGTQALKRTELIQLVVDDQPVHLRRPTLIAAILLKARALPVHSRPDDQRHDLITLLARLEDPRSAREQLTSGETRWLRAIQDKIDFDDPTLTETLGPGRVQAARAAYGILVAQGT